MTRGLLLLLYLYLCVALHNEHQVGHSEEASETELRMVEYNQQFIKIKNQVDYISRTLTLNDSKKFDFLITKCKEVNSGFTALNRSLVKFNLIVTPDTLLCPGVSTFNRTEIRRFLTYTERKEAAMSWYYSTCNDCFFIIEDIDKLIDMTNVFFTLINKTLDGDYCDQTLKETPVGMVDLNRSFFKNNLGAGGWYYGSTTKSDYKVKMFKLSSTYNLTNCPRDKPFVKDYLQLCFSCPQGSLYNLGNETCTSCKLSEVFNAKTEKCELCLGSKETVNNTVVCRICQPAKLQFYNQTTGKCEICDKGRYLDREDHLCKSISCPPATPKFNPTTQKCESCGTSQIISPSDPTRCQKTNYVALCPGDKPLYDDTLHECRECPSGTVFNKSSNQCLSTGS